MAESKSKAVRIFVESHSEEVILLSMFRELAASRKIAVSMCWDAGAVISIAESSLLMFPHNPVVVVLNDPKNDESIKETAERILSRSAPSQMWHVSMVSPDISAWIFCDPKFAAAVQRSDLATDRSLADLATFFQDWVKHNEFNVQAVASKYPEFDDLSHFINYRMISPTKVA